MTLEVGEIVLRSTESTSAHACFAQSSTTTPTLLHPSTGQSTPTRTKMIQSTGFLILSTIAEPVHVRAPSYVGRCECEGSAPLGAHRHRTGYG
eukprot:602393-Prymnesium_polylepis.2